MFVKQFIDSGIAEIKRIIVLHIEENLINTENANYSFQIAHELSKLDDFLLDS